MDNSLMKAGEKVQTKEMFASINFTLEVIARYGLNYLKKKKKIILA